MTFLFPLGLAALAVLPLIYLVHLWHGTRRRLRVPATFLWADLRQVPSGQTRRRWPPPSLLLLLQLLAAGLAALALARPAALAVPPRQVVFVLDASASMQATDVAPSRFEAARARARERLAQLEPGDVPSLVLAGPSASLVASGSAPQVRRGLDDAQPGDRPGDLRTALILASNQVASSPGAPGQILVFTDGAFPSFDPPDALAAPVELVAVGGTDDNQAIVNLQVSLQPSGNGQVALVDVANFAGRAVDRPLRVLADGVPVDERAVHLGARGRVRLSVPLPKETGRVAAQLVGSDALALDDSAEASSPSGASREVLLIAGTPGPLQRALQAMPSVHLRTTDAPAGDGRPADLTVLEGVVPSVLPVGPLLLVDPPAGSSVVAPTPGFNGGGPGAIPDPSHPLLAGVDLAALAAGHPTLPAPPSWSNVVLDGPGGPLILDGRLDDRPAVVFAFDPGRTGVDKSLAFPLLVSNAVGYLLGQASGGQDQVPDALASDIRPRPLPSFTVATPPTSNAAVRPTAEWWPWLAGAALAVLSAEWLAFGRR